MKCMFFNPNKVSSHAMDIFITSAIFPFCFFFWITLESLQVRQMNKLIVHHVTAGHN